MLQFKRQQNLQKNSHHYSKSSNQSLPLLKLNDIDVSNRDPQHVPLHDVRQQLLKVEVEHSGHKVWTVVGLLWILKMVCHVISCSIGSECQEQVRLAIVADDTHGILVELL